MSLDDFYSIFTQLDVSIINEDYCYNYVRLTQSDEIHQNFNLIQMHVSKEGTYHLSVIQKGKRFMP